jgi:hypothetical protein
MLVGRATREACRSNLETWEPSQRLLIDTGKPRKTCVELFTDHFKTLHTEHSGVRIIFNISL